ncbi:hypothetical protein AX14_011502 [Amanita brunnescens Koide BX004]|nr:hypothetical protein AX14_011502 [Amanita brunnescens Koide BX004]
MMKRKIHPTNNTSARSLSLKISDSPKKNLPRSTFLSYCHEGEMLVDNPNIGARRVTLLDERPAPDKEAEKTISALKDLLETENNAKAELRSQVAALEVAMNSERLQAEVREKEEASRFTALQEALEKDQEALAFAASDTWTIVFTLP